MVMYLSHINEFGELACARSVRSEDRCAVAVWILIDKADGVVKAVDFQTAQNRPKNLLLVARHLRLNRKPTTSTVSNCSQPMSECIAVSE